MSESKGMTKKELRRAGWTDNTAWPYGTFWQHPKVFDGKLHTFEEAVHAEKIRWTRDGGA